MIKFIKEVLATALASSTAIASFELKRERAYQTYLEAGGEPYNYAGKDYRNHSEDGFGATAAAFILGGMLF